MRVNIRRDHKGGAVQPAAQGETSTVVVAHVSFPDGLAAAVKTYEQAIWATATGATALHNSNKVTGMPAEGIGYIHIYADNALIAVSRLNTDAGTIELCGNLGKVKGGKHQF
jgi:hypothetical protein